MRKVFAFTLLVIGLGIVILPGCGKETEDDETDVSALARTPEANTIETLHPGLVLVNYQVERGQEVINGSVMNNSNETLANIEIAFDLLNMDSSRVGSVLERTGELEPGDTWQFSVALPADQPVAHAIPVLLNGTPVPAQ